MPAEPTKGNGPHQDEPGADGQPLAPVEATVLFAAISGFTATSEVRDAEKLREIVNVAVAELAAIAQRRGGAVDTFIVEPVMMAIFSAALAPADHADRAVATAVEMRQYVAALSDRRAPRPPQPLTLQVGISTGLVAAGRVGAGQHAAYAVFGDTVKLAARLQEIAEGGQLLVSEATHGMTHHAFAYRKLPPVQVKGEREAVPAFEVR